jgi:L1 cell adhesion molecule like protein
MCEIMDILHKYVPSTTSTHNTTLPNGENYSYTQDNLFEILFGGDQLTVTRARSAIGIRRTHDSDKEKLLGLIPVVEDWHARMALVQVN